MKLYPFAVASLAVLGTAAVLVGSGTAASENGTTASQQLLINQRISQAAVRRSNSALNYLARFPVDCLKIDKSFVLSIEKTADAAAIVHAVVSLGRGLGMKVTAEGVETAEQHLFLRAAGVQSMQGYRFGKPSNAEEIARRIANPGVYRSIESDAVAALAS